MGLRRLLGGMINELSPNMGINVGCVTECVWAARMQGLCSSMLYKDLGKGLKM